MDDCCKIASSILHARILVEGDLSTFDEQPLVLFGTGWRTAKVGQQSTMTDPICGTLSFGLCNRGLDTLKVALKVKSPLIEVAGCNNHQPSPHTEFLYYRFWDQIKRYDPQRASGLVRPAVEPFAYLLI